MEILSGGNRREVCVCGHTQAGGCLREGCLRGEG